MLAGSAWSARDSPGLFASSNLTRQQQEVAGVDLCVASFGSRSAARTCSRIRVGDVSDAQVGRRRASGAPRRTCGSRFTALRYSTIASRYFFCSSSWLPLSKN